MTPFTMTPFTRAPAGAGWRASVRPPDGLSRRHPKQFPTRRERQLFRTGNRHHVYARPSPLEALARFGDADAFFRALCQLNPIAIQQLVPSAGLRQANCYYSNSDAAFQDRYQAFEEYDRVKSGEVTLEGGWRVYSSGAGIGVRLIMQCFLGLRLETDSLIIDPVIPTELNGLTVPLSIGGHPIEVVYLTGTTGRGPVSIELNGKRLDFVQKAPNSEM